MTTPASNDAGPIRMSLSSRFENIELAQHLCGKLLEGREVPEETRHWLLMALREALANAIKHGNRQDVSKRIHVEMDVIGENLQISIRDEGEGFEPSQVDDPLAEQSAHPLHARPVQREAAGRVADALQQSPALALDQLEAGALLGGERGAVPLLGVGRDSRIDDRAHRSPPQVLLDSF